MKYRIIIIQKSDTWKTQLKLGEERVMHSSANIERMPYDNINEVVIELLELLLSRYQVGLETPMGGSNLNFDSVQLFYYKCRKKNFKLGGLYIAFPDWIKRKKQQ